MIINQKGLRLIIVILFCLCTPLLRAQDWLAQEYTMDAGDVVPRTAVKWGGSRLAGTPPVILIIMQEAYWDHDSRQPMELAHAFGFEAEYLLVRSGKGPDAGLLDPERACKLIDSRKWDAVVFWCKFSGINTYDVLPPDVKFRLLSQVVEGTGLVFTAGYPMEICRADRKIIPPVETLLGGLDLLGRTSRNKDYWKLWKKGSALINADTFKKNFYEAYRVGKGLAICFPGNSRGGPGIMVTQKNQGEAVEWMFDHRIDTDYMLAEIGRATLVAAGRASNTVFVSEPTTPWKIAYGKSQDEKATWTFSVNGSPRDITISWQIRDLCGNQVSVGKQVFTKAIGQNNFSVDLPELASGRYYIDIFADGPDGRENFGYAGFEIVSPFQVSVTPKIIGVNPNDDYQGTVLFLANPDFQGVVAAEKVLIELIDKSDRVIEKHEVAAMINTPSVFRFRANKQDSVRMWVRATALYKGHSVGSGYSYFHLLDRRHDKFNVLLWGYTNSAYGHWAYEKLWRTGVTVSMTEDTQAANIITAPFIGGRHWEGLLNSKPFSMNPATKINAAGTPIMQPCCWNDTKDFQQVLDGQDRHWQKGLQRPVYVYNMYDEGPYSGCCLHPTCLIAYRQWLKKEYKSDLASLNLEWQSNYVSWDEINVLEPNDNMEAKALEKGHIPRWMDRYRFAQFNFAENILKKQTHAARKIDPLARIGFEGSGEFGMDIDNLLQPELNGFWCPYDGLQTELVRSLKPKGYIYSFWNGYTKNADAMISRTWRLIMNGAPSVWWWMLRGRGAYHGWLASNNMPYPENQKYLDDCILPLRRGLGDLLQQLDTPHSGIAVYYSPASALAGKFGDAADYNSVIGAHESVTSLIEDCGFQWIYTTKQRVLNGDLQKQGIRFLILPYTLALGQDEVDAFTKFVQDGNTILADLRPGVLSERGRALKTGPADKLFGIRRKGNGISAKLNGNATVKFMNKDIKMAVVNNRADSDIVPDRSVALAEISGQPIFITSPLGKGRTILLNFHLTQYAGEREMDKGRAQRDLFRSLAEILGIKPLLSLNDGSGEELQRVETVRWAQGGVDLYGLYRDGGSATPAEIHFDQKRYVFGLRCGNKGLTDKVQIELLKPGYAEFIAAYPYDPGTPTIVSDRKLVLGGQTVTFSVCMSGVPEKETGVFSYETRLFDPQKRWVDSIPWSVQSVGGKNSFPVRFAYSDISGEWTLLVREITTGRTASIQVTKK